MTATATKNVETKATKKTSAKKAPAAKTEKKGLRKAQYRILKALVKGAKLTRTQISEKAPVDQAACVEYLGSHDPEVRKANDAKHFPSLLTLGLVKAEQHEVEGRNVIVYVITAKGKETHAKAPKE